MIFQVRIRQKQRCMIKALRKFYGRRGAWKNVFSIGDGVYEREALQDFGFQHVHAAASPLLYIKTIKLIEEPSCAQVILQMQVLRTWLPTMVSWTEDIDLDFGSDAEEHRLPVTP